MKKFDVPEFYRSPIISKIKETRKLEDPRKKDFSPTELDFGPVKFLIARHFGFCYGVENAIEIAFKTINENPGKKIYLLSEMIHNPSVNFDLLRMGIQFIMDAYENQLVEWEEINQEDIVIIPAFGTTLEIKKILEEKGIDTVKYNTTCPFVEKVWNRAGDLGRQDFTVIIHGKAKHEETRATFSHSKVNSPSLVIRDIEEAKQLAKIILDETDENTFYELFDGKYSEGFNFKKDLERVGVVNQTTMLASETEAIADLLRQTMIKKYDEDKIGIHFADTHDTLCYATNDNQSAAIGLLEKSADLAIVVGGYNSSNTSHLVELLEEKFPTYFITDSERLISAEEIEHFDIHSRKERVTQNYFPVKTKITIAVTCGASCPDSTMDEVLTKIVSFFPGSKNINEVFASQNN